MARAGRRGAQTALDLAGDPGRFLSTVQIGISLIGILAGAYSGSSLGGPAGERIALLGVDPRTAQTLGFVLVIVLTTYASLVIGELVPKQFALRAPEPIAAWVAPPMRWLSRATAPVVWLLDRTSALVFRLLRLNRESADHVTAEDLHLVVAEAATAGVLEESERALISSVVRLADRPTREVMTPRTEVDWIDVDADQETICRKLIEAGAQPHPGRRRLGRPADRRRPGARHRLLPARGQGDRSARADEVGADRPRPDRRDGRDDGAARFRGADGLRPRRIWPFRRDRDDRQPA